MAAHTAFDVITQEIREAMKKLEDDLVVDTEEFTAGSSTQDRRKLLFVKEIMGQGAMHDNFILPVEPVWYPWCESQTLTLGNVPVMVWLHWKFLDGCIHALNMYRTCF